MTEVLQTQPALVQTPAGRERHLAVATCPEYPEGTEDVAILAEACRAVGLHLHTHIWSQVDVPWAQYEGLLIMDVLDYQHRPSSFRSWLAEREWQGMTILNPPSVVRWNMDKTYLLDLRDQGICMPALQLRPAGTKFAGDWPRGAALVSKPRIGAGGWGLQLHSAGEWNAPRQDMIVQEYQPAVTEQGELGLTCVRGQVVGAIRRRAAEMEFRVGESWGGTVAVEPVTEKMQDQADRVLSLMPETPLYCRLDFWDLNDQPWQLVEVEAIEPDLYLRKHEASASILALALRERLEGPEVTKTS